VVRYRGQYTHQVAITNQRILNITGGKVTFIAKDYNSAVKKPVTFDGVKFLRRFTLHCTSCPEGLSKSVASVFTTIP
jgi:hypothetical protein